MKCRLGVLYLRGIWVFLNRAVKLPRRSRVIVKVVDVVCYMCLIDAAQTLMVLTLPRALQGVEQKPIASHPYDESLTLVPSALGPVEKEGGDWATTSPAAQGHA